MAVEINDAAVSTDNTGTDISLSVTLTNPTTKLVAFVGVSDANVSVDAFTWDSDQSLTVRAGEAGVGDQNNVGIYDLDDPVLGTKTLKLVINQGRHIVLGAVGLSNTVSGVLNTAATDGTSTDATLSLNGIANGMTIDTIAHRSISGPNIGADQTLIFADFEQSTDFTNIAVSASYETGAGSKTMSWDQITPNWSQCAVTYQAQTPGNQVVTFWSTSGWWEKLDGILRPKKELWTPETIPI